MSDENNRASVTGEVIIAIWSLFGCPHRRTTFPRVRKDARGQPKYPAQHYIVCLECGHEIDHTLFDPPAVNAA